MNRRNLLNLGLLGVVLTLAFVAWYEPGMEGAPELPRLTDQDAAAVQRVRIERPGRAAVIAERREGRWQLLEPLRAPANDFRFNAIARVAEATSHARYASAALDLAGFDLEEPKVRLYLDEQAVAFGGSESLSHRRFVLTDGHVHLVDDTAYYHLLGEPSAYVSTALLPEGVQLVALQLPNLTLTRDDDRWQVEPPQGSADAVQALLDEWRHANAMELRPYHGPEAQGTPHEVIRITLASTAQPIEFHVVTRAPELVLGRADLGIAYHLAGEADSLLRLPALAELTP